MKREHIPFLLEVAGSINSNTIISEVQSLSVKAKSGNTPIILPFIGEFSSGKTTLINALTDSHALETATRPTTATIYEVHFGAPKNCADIIFEDGREEHVDNIKTLINDNLKEAKVVTVFDTSTKVSPYTIIVDTPGISSPDPKHKLTLVNFLPSADGIILIVDINQQLTKSLIDFIKTVKLANKEIYAVLTKTDTKSPIDIEKAKCYLAQNCEMEIRHIAAVSATKNDITELSVIFKDIESRKEEIVRKADERRLDLIAEKLNEEIKNIITASSDDTTLENKIQEQNVILNRLHNQIERLIRNIRDSLEPLNREESRKFEDQVTSKLSTLINAGSQNYDAEAVGAINMTASAILGDYRQKVLGIIAKETTTKPKEGEISLKNLPGIDLSSLSLSGLSYNLNLNEIGHEHDNWIKTGVIALGAVAAVGAVVGTGGMAAAAEGALTISTVADVADTVTDVGSVIHNRKVASRIEKAVRYGQQAADKYNSIDQFNNQGYGGQGVGKGMIDSLVGFIAEKTMSKPQRSRAIRLYIDGTLMPEFKVQITAASDQVISVVKDSLEEAANASISEATQNLIQLKDQLKTKKEEFNERITSLRSMQTKLLTLD